MTMIIGDVVATAKGGVDLGEITLVIQDVATTGKGWLNLGGDFQESCHSWAATQAA